jgi:membrane protein required for colicin V production
LALSIVLSIFQKVNVNNMIAKQETLDNSLFYNPIQEVSKFMYPRLEELYIEFKEKTKDVNLKVEKGDKPSNSSTP